MYVLKLLLKDDTDKQVRQINSSYKRYKVQRSYSMDFYVHKDRHDW